ncbi:MAG: hypothetical protein MK078_15135, partial [Crocinitomicaceae bacterium]|nr:hypothetical protein [Crocinitomicaceae bacterium]
QIMIQKEIVDEYLDFMGESQLDPRKYEVISVVSTNKNEFNEIENETLEKELDAYKLNFKEIHKLTDEELDFMIEDSQDEIRSARYNKGRRATQKYLNQLLEEKEKRNIQH